MLVDADRDASGDAFASLCVKISLPTFRECCRGIRPMVQSLVFTVLRDFVYIVSGIPSTKSAPAFIVTRVLR